MGVARSPSTAPALGPDDELPDKLYFKIGEVAQLVGVQAHVLRYWEKEIPFIKPGKTVSNQRRYRRKDVQVFRQIRKLLHEERYTLAGARRKLVSPGRKQTISETAPADPDRMQKPAQPDSATAKEQLKLGFSRAPDDERLQRVRDGLQELIRMTGEDP